MITIKDFMETVDYKITEGSEFGWNCFGPNCHRLEYWSGEQDGCNISILFDTKDQTVYQMEAHDYSNNRAYRWTGPAAAEAFYKECDQKDVGRDEAYDDVKFVELEVEEDMLTKARAIFLGEDYDTRVEIPLVLPDDSLFELMKMAHKRDITFNQLMENILVEEIGRVKGNIALSGDNELIESLEDSLDLREEYDFSNGRKGPVAAMKAKKKKGKK